MRAYSQPLNIPAFPTPTEHVQCCQLLLFVHATPDVWRIACMRHRIRGWHLARVWPHPVDILHVLSRANKHARVPPRNSLRAIDVGRNYIVTFCMVPLEGGRVPSVGFLLGFSALWRPGGSGSPLFAPAGSLEFAGTWPPKQERSSFPRSLENGSPCHGRAASCHVRIRSFPRIPFLP